MNRIIQSTGSAVQIIGAETGNTVKNVAFCDTPERAKEIVIALQGMQEVHYRQAQAIIRNAMISRKLLLTMEPFGLEAVALKIINDLDDAGMIIIEKKDK